MDFPGQGTARSVDLLLRTSCRKWMVTIRGTEVSGPWGRTTVGVPCREFHDARSHL
ncbi:hypothetical protein B0T21DRAFT_363570 [Apiosordaria backusii]|uniref:Uncharacterized protein n=1 Tax=Apiosordaria backusii TaxID=314023 RepID=A0AA40BT39_9PEZI|nr:hypothetical protein B0T21DRAFT_363570 [Apiosordaria backusii]